MKARILPFFFPNKGCGSRCTYCCQAATMGHALDSPAPHTIEALARSARKQRDDRPLEIAYFGGTFTAFDAAEQELYLSVARKLKEEGVVDGVRISTHPGYLDDRICSYLLEQGVDTVELGVQSFALAPLTAAGRNYDGERAGQACRQIQDAGLGLVIQLMPFLPGSALADDLESAALTAGLRPDGVRLFPTVVLKGTVLADMAAAGRYVPATVDEARDRCAAMLFPLDEAKIPVLRIGLQASEMTGRQVESGPYHPALGELSWGAYLADRLARMIQALPDLTARHIQVEPSLASLLLGHGGAAMERLRCALGRQDLQVTVLPGGGTASAEEALASWTGGTFAIEAYTTHVTVTRVTYGGG